MIAKLVYFEQNFPIFSGKAKENVAIWLEFPLIFPLFGKAIENVPNTTIYMKNSEFWDFPYINVAKMIIQWANLCRKIDEFIPNVGHMIHWRLLTCYMFDWGESVVCKQNKNKENLKPLICMICERFSLSIHLLLFACQKLLILLAKSCIPSILIDPESTGVLHHWMVPNIRIWL